jgi:hypothetical protein
MFKQQDGVIEAIESAKATLSDGDYRVVFFPAHRTFGPRSDRSTTDFDYVVHSSNGGKTWEVLDLTCVDERWIKEIFPAYSGFPPIEGARLREKGKSHDS